MSKFDELYENYQDHLEEGKPGYRVKRINGEDVEVRMTDKEKKAREIASLKATHGIDKAKDVIAKKKREKENRTLTKKYKNFNEAYEDYQEYISEAIIKYRDKDEKGRVKWRKRASRKGYRIKKKDGVEVEVRMSPIEQRHRSQAAQKAARRRKLAPKKTKPIAKVKFLSKGKKNKRK